MRSPSRGHGLRAGVAGLLLAGCALLAGRLWFVVGEEQPSAADVGRRETATAATSALCELLTRSDGATDDAQVVAALDTLRALGRGGAPAAETLSGLLSHRCKLYKDRDKAQVVRLRSYVLVTLADVGVPASALPALLDALAHLDERLAAVEVAAAARAVAALGPRGRAFAPHLLGAIFERFSEEEISLERYAPDFPPHEATTAQREAVRALGLVCTADDRQAVETLRRLAVDQEGSERDPRVVLEARRALDLIRR